MKSKKSKPKKAPAPLEFFSNQVYRWDRADNSDFLVLAVREFPHHYQLAGIWVCPRSGFMHANDTFDVEKTQLHHWTKVNENEEKLN